MRLSTFWRKKMCDSCIVEEIPEEDWTRIQREFVGSEFPTPKGGTLTITGVVENKERTINRKKRQCYFSVECSLCSKDTELFPEEFISTKDNLVRGKIPCGCANIPKWTESQNKIRVQRECIKRGYVFHGWFGDYKGNKTKLDLENPETGSRWNNTDLNHFFRGHGDPVEGIIKIKYSVTKGDSIHTQEFYKAGFTKDYKFWRSDRVNNKGWKLYWYYTCPVCSKDEYVKAGVCDGVFEAHVSNLKHGVKSCRCSSGYRWSKRQREYQINKICDEEGLTFIGWETNNGYKNRKSKFKWICKEGHNCYTTVHGFLRGTRCKKCSDIKRKEYGNGNGYFPERKDEIDFLYVINFNNEYIKVGRAFDIPERMKGSTGLLKCSGMILDQLKILKVFTATHKEVYNTEQWCHRELTKRGFYHEESDWTIETFDIDSERLIYRFLEESDLVETKSPY